MSTGRPIETRPNTRSEGAHGVAPHETVEVSSQKTIILLKTLQGDDLLVAPRRAMPWDARIAIDILITTEEDEHVLIAARTIMVEEVSFRKTTAIIQAKTDQDEGLSIAPRRMSSLIAQPTKYHSVSPET